MIIQGWLQHVIKIEQNPYGCSALYEDTNHLKDKCTCVILKVHDLLQQSPFGLDIFSKKLSKIIY